MFSEREHRVGLSSIQSCHRITLTAKETARIIYVCLASENPKLETISMSVAIVSIPFIASNHSRQIISIKMELERYKKYWTEEEKEKVDPNRKFYPKLFT